MQKRFYVGLASLVLVASALVSLMAMNDISHAAEPRDCDSNAIINCGTLTQNELLTKFDKNSSGDLVEVYADYGLNRSDLAGTSSEIKMGRVYKDGRVVVDGKTVATGASSIGRQDMPNSTKTIINGKTYYKRADTQNFKSQSISAIVMMRDGQFYSAILTSCGNPVKATPVPVEKPIPTPPKSVPAAECTALQATRIDRTRYRLSTSASASDGATISSYTFQVREKDTLGTLVMTDTVTSTTKTANSEDFTLEPGAYFARSTVNTTVGTKTAEACTVSFVVAQPNKTEVCNPKTGDISTVEKNDTDLYTSPDNAACQEIKVCKIDTKEILTIKNSAFESSKYSKNLTDCEQVTQAIPATGPAEFIGGGLGIGSLTAATYYWRASRRHLITALLGR